MKSRENMGKKAVLGVLVALFCFAVIVLTVEFDLPAWQPIAGFLLALILVAGLLNIRNAFFIFLIVLCSHILGYIGWRYRLVGMVPGAVAGAVAAAVMTIGWVIPHRTFSRSQHRAESRVCGRGGE